MKVSICSVHPPTWPLPGGLAASKKEGLEAEAWREGDWGVHWLLLSFPDPLGHISPQYLPSTPATPTCSPTHACKFTLSPIQVDG